MDHWQMDHGQMVHWQIPAWADDTWLAGSQALCACQLRHASVEVESTKS
jgi:hypothetical protein